MEAFDPEDTSRNIPLGVSILGYCCPFELWGRNLIAKPDRWAAGAAGLARALGA